jgi:hypothetical protein
MFELCQVPSAKCTSPSFAYLAINVPVLLNRAHNTLSPWPSIEGPLWHQNAPEKEELVDEELLDEEVLNALFRCGGAGSEVVVVLEVLLEELDVVEDVREGLETSVVAGVLSSSEPNKSSTLLVDRRELWRRY